MVLRVCVCVCVCVRACVRAYMRDVHLSLCAYVCSVYGTACIYILMHNYYLCSVTSSCFHGDTFVYGFDNSSIHTWFNRTATTNNKHCLQPPNKSYSYLSLDDDCDNENHSLVTAERK